MALGLVAASYLPGEAATPARAKLAWSDGTPGLQHADKLRRADPHRVLTIGVNLALRNEAQLESFIAQVSDRKSPNYGHYLTPDQFAAAYSPTQFQVQEVVGVLRASGLLVSSVSSNRTIVGATGTVSAVEAAFDVTISEWHDREQNRDFFGNDTEPTLGPDLAPYVVGVAGLNNHYPLHRLGTGPSVGGGPAGGYTPMELKTAYDVMPLASAGYTGAGQPLGLFELDGFRQSNITAYDTQYGLGSPAPSKVLINGGPGPLGSGEIEVELDIEVMHAIAPASPITVWEGPNSDPGVNATYNAMVTSNTTKSNSTSWGICEPNTTQAEMTTLDNIFKQAAAQGQSFFAASGDYGAYDCGDNRLTVDSPANDPYMTAAGGSALTLNADGTYKSESSWANTSTFPATGSGGGPSSYFAKPTWQAGPGVMNSYSNGKRQVPDVSLDADPRTGYSVYVTNSGSTGWNVVGGTSAAAPAWAAFAGIYNQYAAANGKPNLGFANPTLYSTASNAQPYPAFHDIRTGSNLYYPTTASWDYPTGWGSYDAFNIARDFVSTAYVAGVVGSDDELWAFGNGSTGFNALGGTLVAAPAIGSAPQPSGTPEALYVATGSDHNLYVRTEHTGWQWLTDGPFYCLENPAIVTIGQMLYAACEGEDHALWHAEAVLQPGSLPVISRSSWTTLGGYLTAGPAIAAVSGVPTYFAVGTDRAVYVRTVSSEYVRYPWACFGHPAVATYGQSSYFACHGMDHALWYATNNGSGWGTAHSLGGVLTDGPAVAVLNTGPLFFVQGSDNVIYHRSITDTWVRDGGTAKYGLAASGL